MKILAIASAGGHWVQLLRLKPALNGKELLYMSTNEDFAETVKGHEFFTVPDANRWSKLKLIHSAFKVSQIVFSVKPDVIITTGAAPGLMGMIAGKMLGCKTIWVDSIANVEKVSMSGRIAVLFASRVYTQWPHLASNKIIYFNNVLA